jgi:uncharacterized protein
MDDLTKNTEILREAYARWNSTRGGSVEYWLNLMSEDVQIRSVATELRTLAYPEMSRGKPNARAYLEGLLANWEMLEFVTKEFIAQGDRVVALSSIVFRNKATGKIVESEKADIFKFQDGKIIDLLEFFDTARTASAAQQS